MTMEPKRMEGQPLSGERHFLKDVIPLPLPYAIAVFPIYHCNFKCRYCIQSVPKDQRQSICDSVMLSLNIYKKMIDDLAEIGTPIPKLGFGGYGEPLLHPDIIEMVRYAKEKNVVKTIEIVTNGVLLHKEMAEGLVAAGLDRLRISIQGLDAERYKEMCDAVIDFEAFLKDLAYLYEHRGQTRIYLKIMDVELEGHSEDTFFTMFGKYADEIAIGHLIPLAEEIDYEKEFQQDDFDVTTGGLSVNNAEVCPQPFYFMLLNPDGDIVPCCAPGRPIVLGNIKRERLIDIWQGDIRHVFLKNLLMKKKDRYPHCKGCTYYRYGLWPEDYIDDAAEEILARHFCE